MSLRVARRRPEQLHPQCRRGMHLTWLGALTSALLSSRRRTMAPESWLRHLPAAAASGVHWSCRPPEHHSSYLKSLTMNPKPLQKRVQWVCGCVECEKMAGRKKADMKAGRKERSWQASTYSTFPPSTPAHHHDPRTSPLLHRQAFQQ